jgi:large repetitive protein
MQAGLVAGVIGAVVIGLAAPAWPCFAVVTGTTSCSGGFHVVQWTITNGPAGGTMSISNILAETNVNAYAVTGNAPTVVQNGVTNANSIVAGYETGPVTMEMLVTWPLDNFSTMTSGAIDLGDACPGSTPPPTTTTTAATTTTYPTTTTYATTTTANYPTTTTTCSWCGSTTTTGAYPTTTTYCAWCGSTTTTSTYPTTTTNATTTTYGPTTTYPTTTTQPYQPPTCHNPKARPGNHRAVVSWSAQSDSNGTAPIAYVVTPYDGYTALRPQIYDSASTTQVVDGLHNGTTYHFTVAAITETYTGPASDTSNTVTVGVPDSPSGVSATGHGARATVHWKAPANNGAPVIEYLITPYRNGVAQRGYVVAARSKTRAHAYVTNPTSTLVSGLVPGAKYTFKVAAKNARGVGPQSPTSNPVVHKAKPHLVALTHATAAAVVRPLQALTNWLG